MPRAAAQSSDEAVGGDFSQHGFVSLQRNISYPVQHMLLKQRAEHDVMGNPLTDLSYAGNILFSLVFRFPMPKVFFCLPVSPKSAAHSYEHSALLSKVTNSALGGPANGDKEVFSLAALARGGQGPDLPEVQLLGGLSSRGRS